MQLHAAIANLSAIRAFAATPHCLQCGDWMVAPLLTEFFESGEIRHHWVCDACGETCCTSIPLSDNGADGGE